MKKKMALYIYSSADRDARETQYSEMQKYCEKKDLEIVKVYEDSGEFTSADDRPALRAMRADAGKGILKAMVVYQTGVLARNSADISKILCEFTCAGVGVYEVDYTGETDKRIYDNKRFAEMWLARLEEEMKAPDPYARGSSLILASEAMDMDERITSYIFRSLKDPSDVVRGMAAWLLDSCKSDRALEALLKAIEDEPDHPGEHVEVDMFTFGLLGQGERALKAMLNIYSSETASDYSREVAKDFLARFLSDEY